MPAPVIAMIEATVWGGACDLAPHLRPGRRLHTATFAITPAQLGVPYNSAASSTSSTSVGPRIARRCSSPPSPSTPTARWRSGSSTTCVPLARARGLHLRAGGSHRRATAARHRCRRSSCASCGRPPELPETFERIQALRRKVYDSPDYHRGRPSWRSARPVFSGTAYRYEQEGGMRRIGSAGRRPELGGVQRGADASHGAGPPARHEHGAVLQEGGGVLGPRRTHRQRRGEHPCQGVEDLRAGEVGVQ